MSFQNATPFQATLVPTTDKDGNAVALVVVKATFDILPDGRVVPSDEPSPLRPGDEMWSPKDPNSSIRLPGDLGLDKRGADVVIVGEAVSAKPVKVVDVVVKVGQHSAPLRVHGERVFCRGLSSVVVGPAAAFERMPIVYERAYGGASDDFTMVEERNPSGVGFDKKKSDLLDRPAPQIEHPARPHESASDRHPPVGYGAIMTHWLPRRAYAGTYDEAWTRERMPLLPADFDPRFNNVAHPSLVFDAPLAAGTPVAILGMTLGAPLSFAVPTLPVVVRGRYDVSGKVALPIEIDTLVVQPSLGRLEIAGRRVLAVGRGRDVLREASVDEGA